jgi:hypothetical protein
VPAATTTSNRSSWVSAILPAVVLFSGCSERDPVSPTGAQPELVRQSLRGNAALEIHDQARLLADGNIEIVVRALCPKGYVRQESGPLSITQGLAYAEGFPQVQRGGCSGHWDSAKVLARRIDPSEPAFQRGAAQVSMTFAAENPDDPTGIDVLQVSVVKQVTLR